MSSHRSGQHSSTPDSQTVAFNSQDIKDEYIETKIELSDENGKFTELAVGEKM